MKPISVHDKTICGPVRLVSNKGSIMKTAIIRHMEHLFDMFETQDIGESTRIKPDLPKPFEQCLMVHDHRSTISLNVNCFFVFRICVTNRGLQNKSTVDWLSSRIKFFKSICFDVTLQKLTDELAELESDSEWLFLF